MFNHSKIDHLGFLRIAGHLYPKYCVEDDLIKVSDVHRGEVQIWKGLKGVLFCDIDGTIADLSHRRVFLEGHPKNYPAFEKGQPHDTPIPHIIQAVQDLHEAGWTIIMCTGRSETTRHLTEAWLRTHDVPYKALYMRPEFEYEPGTSTPKRTRRGGLKPDHRKDSIVKYDLLQSAVSHGFTPDVVFDDRNQVVDMWREHGLPVVQVAHGDF